MSAAEVISGAAPWHVEVGDALSVLRTIPSGVVQTCVSSPPYYALRDYGVEGQIGLEATPVAYVARLVEVFEEVRRVLRDDGTLWLNVGDSYASGGMGGHRPSPSFNGHADRDGERVPKAAPAGTKPKDLIGVPWLLAFALRDAGWYLRAECIWAKKSPMPESVRDRPTRAHEQVFLFSKSPRYVYDLEAERVGHSRHWWLETKGQGNGLACPDRKDGGDRQGDGNPAGRNLWTVWPDIAPSPTPDAHFALMPLALAARCVRLGTSAKGCCPHCGAAWLRETSRENRTRMRPTEYGKRSPERNGIGSTCANTVSGVSVTTLGHRPACACPPHEPIGCLVLDPFAGGGTTGLAARNAGHRFLGVELNPQYAEMARRRIGGAAPLLDHHDRRQAARQVTLFDELGRE